MKTTYKTGRTLIILYIFGSVLMGLREGNLSKGLMHAAIGAAALLVFTWGMIFFSIRKTDKLPWQDDE